MKKSEDVDVEGQSGLFLGSEPLHDVRHRRSYKLAGDDSDKKDGDAGDDDSTDSDEADTDLTDEKDEDSGDSDGKD